MTDLKCDMCSIPVKEESRYSALTTDGLLVLCNYCFHEGLVIYEEDEKRQREGLLWAKKMLTEIIKQAYHSCP